MPYKVIGEENFCGNTSKHIYQKILQILNVKKLLLLADVDHLLEAPFTSKIHIQIPLPWGSAYEVILAS